MAIINGTDGANTLVGTADADTINGLGGDDTLNALTRPPVVGGPIDVVDGGDGFDTLIVDATAESDAVSLGFGIAPRLTVRSTSGNFYLDAYNVERVRFTGGAGNDTINTGDLSGTVDGGAGTDYWLANLGHVFDDITFELGSTLSIAAAGLTSIRRIERLALTTGSGDDAIIGGDQADTINTGDGDDIIDAKTRPAVVGGPIDVVDGGSDTDTLVVNAAAETEHVRLYAGNSPTFQVRSNSGNFYLDAYNMELVDFTGGSGDDIFDTGDKGIAVNGNAGIDLWIANLSAIGADIAFTLGSTTTIAAAGLTSILGIERISLTTGKGNDTIVGGDQADTINSGNGDDTIDAKTRPAVVGGPIDVVDGGNGTDTLVINASAETESVQLYSGFSPSFQLRSSSGNFYLDAYNMEKVRVIGGGGNDSLNTGTRGEKVDGRGGIDHWISDLSALTTDVIFTLGTTSAIADAGLSLIRLVERISMKTGSGNDQIVGGGQADTIETGQGDDIIDAGKRPAVVGGPIDVVNGGNGMDTLVIDASAETKAVQLYSGYSPSFQLRSNSGNFYLDAYEMEKVSFIGGGGGDSINTGRGAIAIDGGTGIDTWIADLGHLSDAVTFKLGSTTAILPAGIMNIASIERISLITGTGNDRITGRAQADTITTGDGNDIIDAMTRPAVVGGPIDVVNGGNGIDTLVVNAATQTTGVRLFAGYSPSFQVRSDSGKFYLDAYEMEKVRFTGGSGNDQATGLGLADTLKMGGGNDFASGGGGNDTIDAGNGDDTITGGRGADTLTGGGGIDTFIYASLSESRVSTAEIDTIADFATGTDKIDLGAIDADFFLGNGNSAFAFIGGGAFSGVRGELRATAGLVEADVNGDMVADFRIILANGATLVAGDFVL